MPTIRTRPVCPAPASPVPRMGPACTFPPGRPGLPVRLVCGRFPDASGNVELGALALLDAVGVGNLAPEVGEWLRDGVMGDKADKATTLAGYGITDAYTKTETDTAVSAAVSAEATARNTAISAAISAMVNSAPAAFDTLKEIADWIGDAGSGAQAVINQVSNKVDKIAGKGLSSEDYTTAEKQKLGGIAAGAQVNVKPDWGAAEGSDAGILNKPETMPPSAHTHAQGDVTGLPAALGAKLSRAEAEAGYTRWTVKRDGVDVTDQVLQPEYDGDYSPPQWVLNLGIDGEIMEMETSPGGEDSVGPLSWTAIAFSGGEVTYSATRTRITPTKTSQLTNDGDGASGFATVSQLPSVPAISTNIASDAASDAKTASPKAVKAYADTKRGLGDLGVRGAPYFDASDNEVGSIYFDGVKVNPVPGNPQWMAGDFEIYPYPGSVGSYRLTDFSVVLDPPNQDFTLNAANNYTATVMGHVIYGVVGTLAKASDIPAASDATPQPDGTAAAGSSAAFARGDHVHPTDTSRASTADVALAPVYSQPQWTFTGQPEGAGIDVTWSDEYQGFRVGMVYNENEYGTIAEVPKTSTSFSVSLAGFNISATRPSPAVIGYTLGSQTTKPLQPKGDYQPALTAAQLAAIADVANKALASKCKYEFNAATVTLSTTTDTNDTAAVTGIVDHAKNAATLASTVTDATITIPARTDGYTGDLFLSLTVDGSAPSITFTDAATSADLDAIFGAAQLADIDTGRNLIFFSEVEDGKWKVAVEHEDFPEVTP